MDKQQETVLKITNYDEIFSLRGDRLLHLTKHEEIFSLDETKLPDSRDANVKTQKIYEEDDNFFDYIKEIKSPLQFDFRKFFNYKQKRISSKRAQENLHGDENYPLVNLGREGQRPRRQKLPYCQSEIFPSSSSSHSSFLRRWHNFSLPRFTIYRMNRQSVGSLRFDQIASTLAMDGMDSQRSASEIDFESAWRLNELWRQEGNYERFGLKSHLRQHKEDNDVLELFRLYTAGLKKAPQINYDPAAEIKPSLKHVASLEVMESDQALFDSLRGASVKSDVILVEDDKKKRDHVKFEQKPSTLPDFRYTGEEQFRVIVYDDEVPLIDFELDQDSRRKRPRKTASDESVLRLRPDIRDLPEIMSDISLTGMGDYKMKPGDIGKPVMLKFKNMPELLGWFKKINEKELALADRRGTGESCECKGKVKKDLREIVVKTPLVGLRRFKPLDVEAGIEFKKLDVTNHNTILSIVPKGDKNDVSISDSDQKEECLSMETVVDKVASSCNILKKKVGMKSVTYKTKTSRVDSLQRIKSSIVNEVVKKVASYFSKDLKPKLEASIKDGQCRCCRDNVPLVNPGVPCGRACMCNQKKPPKVSRGVSVDVNQLSSDVSNAMCSNMGSCRPNFSIFACPTITYFKNTGVNANTIQNCGSSGDSSAVAPFDCQKILKMYENLAKTAEEQMDKLKEYQNLMNFEKPMKHVRFCEDISTSKPEEGRGVMHENDDGASKLIVDKLKSNKVVCEKRKVADFMQLDGCSSNDSIPPVRSEHFDDILNVKIDEKVLHAKCSKTTSCNKEINDDTCDVSDISDFECYINYICTHSEKCVQISQEFTSKKLKRQTSSLIDSVKFRRNSTNCGDLHDLNNNGIEDYSKDLVTLFKRDCNKKRKCHRK